MNNQPTYLADLVMANLPSDFLRQIVRVRNDPWKHMRFSSGT